MSITKFISKKNSTNLHTKNPKTKLLTNVCIFVQAEVID